MNWTPLIGPAVVAAVISALVAWVTTSRRFAVDRELAERKITADITLADRKFEFDSRLAERRVELDTAVIEKKIALDRAFQVWKRKAEFAEEILADFYEAQDVIRGVRSPLVMAGEGATRQPGLGEAEDDTRALNAYYATIERMKLKDGFFAKLYAKRYRFSMYFGETASKPYDALLGIQRRLAIAAHMLLETHDDRKGRHLQTERLAWRKIVSEVGPDDPIPGELDAMVREIEGHCRSAILGDV